jgi:hypothetical protein
MKDSKQARYNELLKKFKKQKFNSGFVNPYDLKTTFKSYGKINPWELWHGDINKPDIMFIGQDFSHTEYFEKCFDKKNELINDTTDTKVNEYFIQLGYKDIGLPNKKTKDLPLFFSNAVWAIKEKGKSAPIKNYWDKEEKLIEFWKELIQIVEPCNIIAMGKIAYLLMCKVYGEAPLKTVREAVERNGNHNPSNLFVVQHCSGINHTTNPAQHVSIWKNLKDKLKSC